MHVAPADFVLLHHVGGGHNAQEALDGEHHMRDGDCVLGRDLGSNSGSSDHVGARPEDNTSLGYGSDAAGQNVDWDDWDGHKDDASGSEAGLRSPVLAASHDY